MAVLLFMMAYLTFKVTLSSTPMSMVTLSPSLILPSMMSSDNSSYILF